MTDTAPVRKRGPGLLWVAAVCLTAAAYGAALLLAPLNQDEGWYLYAARMFRGGLVPHRDFFYTQGLAMPAVYAALAPLWEPLGLLGGRLVSAVFALTGLFLAGECAARLFPEGEARRTARLALWVLLGCSLYYVAFTAIPKAYALCTAVEAGAFCALGGLSGRGRGRLLRAAAAGLLLGILPGIRLSMGILLPVAGGWLLVRRRTFGDGPWVAFGLGGTAGLAAVLGPELAMLPGFLEAQRFHLLREPAAGAALSAVACLGRLVRGMPAVGAAAAACCVFLPEIARALGRERGAQAVLWGLSAAALTAVHLAAPVPYDDYLVPAVLPAALALSAGLAALPLGDFRGRFRAVLAAAAVTAGVWGSAAAEGWFVIRQDRFWLTLKTEPDLLRLRRAAAAVRRAAAERNLPPVLWTQDTYLAVEAGMRVPRGLEMGPFGLTSAPDAPQAPWAPLRTDRLDATYAEAGVAARSGYTFLLDAPRMTDLRQNGLRDALLEGWRRAYPEDVAVFPDFGQQHTTLTVAVKP